MDNSLPENQRYLAATRAWLSSVVIGLNLCPFAQRELERGSIAFRVIHETAIEDCLRQLIDECDRLDSDSDIETSLLIYSQAFTDFDDYLDFLELAQALLYEQAYEGVYQLASFYPDYCFDGVEADDAANYTNRSPYPMLHLLRESSIERAVTSYPSPEQIPERNVELTRKLGVGKMQALLSACFQAE